jgi:hypothetical protein
MGIGMLPVGVAGVIGLCGGGVWPTEGRAEGGTNSLALGFRTNSFAFGLSLDLVTLIGVVEGGGCGTPVAVGPVAAAFAAGAEPVEGVVGAPAPGAATPGGGATVGGVLAGVGVRCSTLSCLFIMLAVGGEAFL